MSQTKKPTCQLIGIDGNVFNIIGRVSSTLRNAGLQAEARDFASRAMKAQNYNAVLALCGEYVEII
jgi:hypothetical protein